MDVRLHLYLEGTSSGPVWWSESPEVPGFHAIEARLQDLIVRSEQVIREILDEVVLVHPILIGEPPSSAGEPVHSTLTGDAGQLPPFVTEEGKHGPQVRSSSVIGSPTEKAA